MLEKLGQEDMRQLLQRNKLGRMGCIVKGAPYVLPINYSYDGKNFYLHSLPGQKIEALRTHPHICLQVDEIKDDYNWRSVIAFGQYEEVTEADERDAALALLFKQLPHLTPVESRLTKGLDETIVFRIRVEKITGVSEIWR